MIAHVVNIYTGIHKMNRHIPGEGGRDTMWRNAGHFLWLECLSAIGSLKYSTGSL